MVEFQHLNSLFRRLCKILIAGVFLFPILLVADTTLYLGQTTWDSESNLVKVPLKASSFANIGGFQLSVGWDPLELKFMGVGGFDHSEGMDELFLFGVSNFNLDATESGVFSVLYEQIFAADVALPEDAQLFAIWFKVLDGWSGQSSVSFANEPTPSKIASFEGNTPALQTQDGWVEVLADPAVNQAPTISLLGDVLVEHQAGWPYLDAGASAVDPEEGSLNVTVTGQVLDNQPGLYRLTYSATDQQGLVVTTIRDVQVVDTLAPVINLLGDDSLQHELGTVYVDAGAEAVDKVDGPVEVRVVGHVEVNQAGYYELTYSAEDLAGNLAETVRTVQVKDPQAPTSGQATTLQLTHLVAEAAGQEVVIFMNSWSFSNIGGFQYSLRWNPSQLKFKGLMGFEHSEQSDELFLFGTSHFNLDAAAQGVLSVLYEQILYLDAALPDGAQHFGIRFEILEGWAGESFISFADQPTPGKLASFEGTAPHLLTRDGKVELLRDPSVNLAPAIVLNGEAVVEHEAGLPYVDAGAVATDTEDGFIAVQVTGEVDITQPGTYTLNYRAVDQGGLAASVNRLIRVVDSRPPVLTLLGEASVDLPLGMAYVDEGAKALDGLDGVLPVIVSGSVNVNAVGDYVLTYQAADNSGNRAEELVRIVHVVEGEPNPEEAETIFELSQESAAQAGDELLVTMRSWDFANIGGFQFSIRWNPDELGFKAVEGFEHSEKPEEIFLFSENHFNLEDVDAGVLSVLYEQALYLDAGLPDAAQLFAIRFEVLKGWSGSSAVLFADEPTARKVASFKGKTPDLVTRDGLVVLQTDNHENQPPIIVVNGALEIQHEAGSPYEDAGAIALDPEEGQLEIMTQGIVNIAQPGLYTLVYQATDQHGLVALAQRDIQIVDSTPPVVTLIGAKSLDHPMGVAYEDAGASALDLVDGDVPVLVSGGVDVTQAGFYELTYVAEDMAGNKAQEVKRQVQVVDITAYQATFGLVFDGPIAGATVFHDQNGNGVWDSTESGTRTDDLGRFYWADMGLESQPNVSEYGLNDGFLVAYGGVDTDSGIPNRQAWRSPYGARLISPLTDFFSHWVNRPNPSEDLPREAFLNFLDLADVASMMSRDPYQLSIEEGVNSKAHLLLNSALHHSVEVMKAFYANQGQVSELEVKEAFYKAMTVQFEDGLKADFSSESFTSKAVELTADHLNIPVGESAKHSLSYLIAQSYRNKQLALKTAIDMASTTERLGAAGVVDAWHVVRAVSLMATGAWTPEAVMANFSPGEWSSKLNALWLPQTAVDSNGKPTVRFGLSDYSVGEGHRGNEPILVFREGSINEAINVMVNLRPITAVFGSDLMQLPILFQMAPYQRVAELSIDKWIMDDVITEDPETFEIEMGIVSTQASSLLFEAGSQATVTVIDDDQAGSFSFARSSQFVPEDQAGRLEIFVKRENGLKGSVALKVEIDSDSTASLGQDFQLNDQELNFADGQWQGVLYLEVEADRREELSESLILHLVHANATPEGTDAMPSSTFTLMIENDDTEQAPNIEKINDIMLSEDQALGPVMLDVSDDVVPEGELTLDITSDNDELFGAEGLRLFWDDIHEAWFIQGQPVMNQSGKATMTLTVSDGLYQTHSDFTVTVHPENDYPYLSEIPSLIEIGEESVRVPIILSDIEDETTQLQMVMQGGQGLFQAHRVLRIEYQPESTYLVVSHPGTGGGLFNYRLLVLDQEGAGYGRDFNVQFLTQSEVITSILRIERDPDQKIFLTWDKPGKLLRSSTADGVYELIPDATSPHPVGKASQMFYKLQQDP